MRESRHSVTEQTDTRQKIMTAALKTIKELGVTGVSARAIAATGGFNQALIFYHFGSVNNLLTEAARTTSAERVAAYEHATADVETLTSLVDVARRLHRESQEDGSVAALTQLMAGAASDPSMGKAVLEGFERWIDLVEATLRRAMEGEAIADAIPPREAAYSVAALFLGIELMARLDPARSEADSVFDALHELAALVESMPAVMARFIRQQQGKRA